MQIDLYRQGQAPSWDLKEQNDSSSEQIISVKMILSYELCAPHAHSSAITDPREPCRAREYSLSLQRPSSRSWQMTPSLTMTDWILTDWQRVNACSNSIERLYCRETSSLPLHTGWYTAQLRDFRPYSHLLYDLSLTPRDYGGRLRSIRDIGPASSPEIDQSCKGNIGWKIPDASLFFSGNSPQCHADW